MRESLARSRNRISDDALQPQLENYWDVFLLKHRNPRNVALHCMAFVLMYMIPILAIMMQDWRILMLWPLTIKLTRLNQNPFSKPPPNRHLFITQQFKKQIRRSGLQNVRR